MDNETQEQQPTNDLTTGIMREELNQHSDEASANKKAALGSDEFLTAIQQGKPMGYAPGEKEAFDELRQKRAEEQAAKEPAKEPALPESLQAADPSKLQAVLDKYNLEVADLADSRWADLVANELSGEQQQEQQRQPQNQAEYEQQYFQNLAEKANRVNDPAVMQRLNYAIAPIFGATPDDPAKMESVAALTNILGQAGINLCDTYIPTMIGEYIEAVYPGMGDFYVEAVCANTWSAVKASDPRFASLPNFDDPAFAELADKLHAENAWLNNFSPTDSKGNPLPPREALRQRALVTAKLAIGEQFSPEQALKNVQMAYETGKKHAAKNERKVATARSLGSGRSKGSSLGVERPDTSFRDAILSHMRSLKSGHE